jgi:predicted dehydrogenase
MSTTNGHHENGRPNGRRNGHGSGQPNGRPKANGAPSRRRQGKVRVGVVGLGYWGPNLVRSLHELPEAQVAVMCDLRRENLDRIGHRYPGVEQTTRFEEVLEDETIDAVAIATPVATHFAVASAALEAGQHVFIEKPLAASSAEAAELIELAERKELLLIPGHTFLYSPAVNWIRDFIASGELGDIYFISASRVNLGPVRTDVSVVWDLGPHDFSILRYWLGENPSQVSAVSRGWLMPGVPDVAFIDLEFASGPVAHVELSWLAPSKLRRTTIVGSKRMVIYDDTSVEPVRVYDSGVMLRDPESFGEFQLSYRTGDITSPRIPVAEPLVHEMRDFCAAVRGVGESRDSARFGLEIVQIIESVEDSLARRGEMVATADAAALLGAAR